MAKSLPDRARVVIVGGGIVGCGTAYAFAKNGWKDVVLVERKTLAGGGATWHAAGLITQLRNNRTLIDIARHSIDIYHGLEKESGLPTGFRAPGSITVARTPGRMDELKKIASLGRAFGIEIEPLSPGEAGEFWPQMRIEDLSGGLYIPKDGQTVPALTTLAMAKVAEDNGITFVENVAVTDFLQEDGLVTGVVTDHGDIACEYVVNAAGLYGREVGRMAGVDVPQYPAEHMFLVTNAMGLPYDAPSLRDPDEQIYFRRDVEETGAVLMGGFESVSKPWKSVPEDYHFGLVEPDWEHFKVFWENAVFRVPAMEEAGINRFNVSAEVFTPDQRYNMGEVPELTNYFVATGLNSTGIAAGPGVGNAIAEWIIEGHPTMDLTEVDIRRYSGWQNNESYLHDRTVESVGLLYGMHWPQLQPDTARNARLSPIHDRLAERRAAFGVVAGWERANWFAPPGVEPKYEYSYHRQNWFEYSAEEHRAVREAVGMFDQSSFAKFMVQGKDAEAVLNTLCANDVAVEPGRVVYTAMLNERGGFESDLTVTRVAEDAFWVVTGGASTTRDFHWIQDHVPDGAHAFLTEITSSLGVLGVMGPRSRELLSRVTDADLSNEAFPFMTSQEIEIGYAKVRASRITYVGELGWELYIPAEFMGNVFDSVVEQGDSVGLRLAGFHAMDSLRIERAYRAWGHDLTDQETPIEAGLSFAVAFDKDAEFLGKGALLKQREEGVDRRLAVFTLDDPEPILLGDEAIYRDGVLVGRTTSGVFGHTLGRSVGLGYVEDPGGVVPSFVREGSYEIEVLAERSPAKARMRPAYDPKSERVRM